MAGFCRKRPRMQEGHFNEKNGIKTRGLLPSIHLPSWALNLLPCASPREYIWSFIHISVHLYVYLYPSEIAGSCKKDPKLLCCAEQSDTESVHCAHGKWYMVPCEVLRRNTQISKTQSLSCGGRESSRTDESFPVRRNDIVSSNICSRPKE